MPFNLARILRHGFSSPRLAGRAFPPRTLAAIDRAIQQAEATHAGEIRFVVEASLDGIPLLRGQSARERAMEVFSQLRVWDTEHNNGILIYVLMADRRVEIVADRGIHRNVGATGWKRVCRHMESALREKDCEAGVVDCIEDVAGLLRRFAPPLARARNELPDTPLPP